MQTSAGKRLASALAAALSVATLTAFAVAPLTEEPLPPNLRIIEPVSLLPQALHIDGDFLRQTVISRGEIARQPVSQARRSGPRTGRLRPQRPDRAEAAAPAGRHHGARRGGPAEPDPVAQLSARTAARIRTQPPMRLRSQRETAASGRPASSPWCMDRTLVTRTATITYVALRRDRPGRHSGHHHRPHPGDLRVGHGLPPRRAQGRQAARGL